MSIGRALEISWIAARGTPPAIRCSKPFVTRFGSQPINRLKPFVLEGKGRPTLPRGFIRVGQLALQDFVFVAVHRPEEQEETEASRSNSSLRTKQGQQQQCQHQHQQQQVKNENSPGGFRQPSPV